MQEIRFHGRGGQGTVVASILLAKAFFQSGYFVQSFPAFGVERRGAPVEAYLRINKEKILMRTNVSTPDHVLVQDVQLLQTVDVAKGLKPGGWVLLNTPDGEDFLSSLTGFKIAAVDATGIALEHDLGTHTHPIVNTAMIGAFVRILEMPPIDAVISAIRADIAVKTAENARAAVQTYEKVHICGNLNNRLT